MTGSKRGGCPICGAERSARYRPFCSKRCADVDLGKWMTGGYAAPAAEEDEIDDDDLGRERESGASSPRET